MMTMRRAAGLTEKEAQDRLLEDGFNDLPRQAKRGPWRILFEVLREPMLLLLIAGGLVYLLIGDRYEALLLLAFANFSVLITFLQESRTERVLDALRDLTSPRALVIRDGVRRRIPGRDVARGDLVILSEGDRVPADCVILEGANLVADESLLTGEAVPVTKRADPFGAAPEDAHPGGDGLSVAYSGTLIVGGQGLARVFATGVRSEIGRIGRSLGELRPEPPRLQVELRRVARIFGAVALVVCVATLILQGLISGDWLAASLQSIALAMALLPEEFPVVLTVFLAIGAWRISTARVLTRRAAAIESLGAATVLCTDKTGTLTQNRMKVAELRTSAAIFGAALPREGADADLARFSVLASAREPVDPMEKAFHEYVEEPSGGTPFDNLAQVHAYGISPDLLAVTNVWSGHGGDAFMVAAKGAPEALADLCRLDVAAKTQVLDAAAQLAKSGMRVVGVASATTRETSMPATPRSFDFEFLGLIGLADPLRGGVREAVAECHSAGVRVVMVTGDFPATAAAIAREAGIDGTNVVTGAELARMSEAELSRRLDDCTVFARIMPEQKLRLVNALKAKGEIVAMTGDGVNDAPALKAAHIGVAMGGRGADVAREAAGVVLLDDDFGSIVKAIRLGRRVYDNLGKAAAFIIAVHVPIAALALAPLLSGLPILFGPAHIAFLEMFIDPVCALVFEAENEEEDVMRRPPRNPDRTLVDIPMALRSAAQGCVAFAIVAASVGIAHARGADDAELRTLAFICLIAVIAALILANRSFSASVLEAIVRPNRPMTIIFPVVFITISLIITFEPSRALFRFSTIGLQEAAFAAVAGIVALLALEALKRLGRRRAAGPAVQRAA